MRVDVVADGVTCLIGKVKGRSQSCQDCRERGVQLLVGVLHSLVSLEQQLLIPNVKVSIQAPDIAAARVLLTDYLLRGPTAIGKTGEVEVLIAVP